MKSPLLSPHPKPGQSEAGKFLHKARLNQQLSVDKGRLCLDTPPHPDSSYLVEDLPRRGEKIGLTFFSDSSFLIWRRQRAHVIVTPAVFSLGSDFAKDPLLLVCDNTTLGPSLGARSYKPSVLSPIFSPNHDNALIRRWAARLRADLLQHAWAQWQRHATTPIALHSFALKSDAYLAWGLTYSTYDYTFLDQVEAWLLHEAVSRGMGDDTLYVVLYGAYRNGPQSLVDAKFTLTDDLWFPRKPILALQHAFETYLRQGVFGPIQTRFSCLNTGQADVIQRYTLPLSTLSAHQRFDALSWSPKQPA
jgi:hypothetical protein